MSERDEVIERMVADMAVILAHLEKQRSEGKYVALSGPEAKALVSGYDAVFLAEASASAGRSTAARNAGDPRGEAGGAAAAILCAVAACEAALSEYLARQEFALGNLSEPLAAIREERDTAKQWKALFKELAPSYDFGTSKEYLEAVCLFQTRDLVAHRNARTLPLGSFPESLSDCVRQKIVPVVVAKDVDWTSVVFTAPVAEWAAKTAESWLHTVEKQLPTPTMK